MPPALDIQDVLPVDALDSFRVDGNYSNDLEFAPGFFDGLTDLHGSGYSAKASALVARLMLRMLEKEPVRVGRDSELNTEGYLPSAYLESEKYRQMNRAFAVHLGLAAMRLEDKDGQIAKDLSKWLEQPRKKGDLSFRLRLLLCAAQRRGPQVPA
jgi:hypothetical protein